MCHEPITFAYCMERRRFCVFNLTLTVNILQRLSQQSASEFPIRSVARSGFIRFSRSVLVDAENIGKQPENLVGKSDCLRLCWLTRPLRSERKSGTGQG